MAKAVGPPAGSPPIETPTSWRWHVRTASIPETTEALSRLWVRVAHETAAAGSAEGGVSERGGVATDLRLAVPIAAGDGVRVRMRTSVLTLVVVAPRPETVDRAMAAVATLASRHPSRAVIVSPADPDGPSRFDAHVYASCQLPERASSEICTEEILIKVGGELSQHLAGAVAPLLIHDLPVVLWWPDDVPFERHGFLELASESDRLFVDSGHFRGDGRDRLRGMATAMHDGLVVHDVSWMRLMLWRELLASLFDHPLLLPELRSVVSIRVDVARPGRQERLARALLFVGWLMSMLRLTVVTPLERRAGTGWGATIRAGKREIDVAIHAVEVEYSGAVRSSGSLVRAEIVAARTGARTAVRVTRQSDHLLATADWNGAQVARRATRLEPFDEMPYLAEALDRTAHDRIFDRALAQAIALIGDAPAS
jgi:glucose-6-phosphate dehydrogenase assembly protein OpcA